MFGDDVTVISLDWEKIQVKVMCIPSMMRTWVLGHCNMCEVIAPRKFREEIS